MNKKEASHIWQCINNLVSTQSKTKMLRLIHFDVYCGKIMKKIGLTGNDTCIRCLEKETIKHLMMDCPNTQEIWWTINVNTNEINAILGINLSREKLEIRADLL